MRDDHTHVDECISGQNKVHTGLNVCTNIFSACNLLMGICIVVTEFQLILEINSPPIYVAQYIDIF